MSKPNAQAGIRALSAFVVLIAVLLWGWRIHRDSQPSYLYAGFLAEGADFERVHAAQAFGSPGTETGVALRALLRALVNDRQSAVRQQSAVSLGRLLPGAKDSAMKATAITVLIEALNDKVPSVRTAVADALGKVGQYPDTAIPALLRTATDPDESVRGSAIAALGLIERNAKTERTDVRRAIAACLSDRSFHVRELGIYALWAAGEKSPQHAIALLNDPNVLTRRSAAIAVSRNGTLASKVCPELAAALSDKDPAVRTTAARALGNSLSSSPAVFAAIHKALSDPAPEVSQAAKAALDALAGQAPWRD